MWTEFDTIIIKVMKSPDLVTTRDLKFCMASLLLTTLFHSWQKPGAVKNLKVSQFQTKEGDTYIASVTDHKTGLSGSAKLMFDSFLYNRVNKYIKYTILNQLHLTFYFFLQVDNRLQMLAT